MIKLLIIMTSPLDISGISNNLMNYYKYLDKSDMIIDFVAPNKVPERIKNRIIVNNGNIYELRNRTKNPLLYFITLLKIIKRNNYNIVHAHGSSSTLALEMLAAKYAGTKIRIAHSRNTVAEHKIAHKLFKPFFNKSYTHGFACGKAAGEWLFKSDDFTIIKNGNDIAKFTFNLESREFYRNKFNIEDKIVLGHIGHFNYQKNHNFLINVFHNLTLKSSKYVLLLVGDGSLRLEIENKVKKLGIENSVIFTGKSLEVDRLIQAMDLLVFPSRYEGLPNVLIEAQISGLPCLVSNNITNEVNLTNLVQFMNLDLGVNAWVDYIINMKTIKREETSKNAVRKIIDQGYSIKDNSIELKKIYENLISSV